MGDPVQLPATVISDRADKHGYSTSLFKRLQTSGFPVQVGVWPPTLQGTKVCSVSANTISVHWRVICALGGILCHKLLDLMAVSVRAAAQMLDTQYRMHPRIAQFPAATFYAGNLRNGEGVEAGTSRTWHEHPVRPLAASPAHPCPHRVSHACRLRCLSCLRSP